MSLNKAMLIGRVGKDPEIRYIGEVNNSTKCASFSLATSERYKNKNGEVKETTEWHSIVCWRQVADVVEKYVHKGDQVYVEGKIHRREWADERGEKRYATEIVVDTIQFLGNRQQQEISGNVNGVRAMERQAQAARPQNTPAPQVSADDDDLPF